MLKNKILFDTRWIGQHGIGRFAKEVFSGLENYAIQMPKHSNPSHPLDFLYISRVIHQMKPDLFFSPGYNSPFYLTTNTPYVFTIHDLIHLEIRAESSFMKQIYYEYLVKPAIHRAYKVFTVSHHAKRKIVEWSGVAENKIVVVGNGVSQAFHPQGSAWQANKPYFLYVGNHKPHKNINFLLKAYSLWPLHREIDLYFSGVPASQDLIHQYGLDQCVRFSGKIDDDLLAQYYRGAIATVIPSLYEGFGLPALESMACGTPVISSNQTALPEVVGEGGILIDPLSIEMLVEAFDALYSQTTLRASLIEKALFQSRCFSWERTNAIIHEVLVNE